MNRIQRLNKKVKLILQLKRELSNLSNFGDVWKIDKKKYRTLYDNYLTANFKLTRLVDTIEETIEKTQKSTTPKKAGHNTR